ncbi:hypothetical protein [Arthrobacter sp. MP_M4]|uniref:hypothetical protein n=1 Tax=Arthrobacter sp. MP_M4 TaxID=3071714 RepID=UPI002E10DE42
MVGLGLALRLRHGLRGDRQHFEAAGGLHAEGGGQLADFGRAAQVCVKQPGQQPLPVELLVAGQPCFLLGIGLLDAAYVALDGVEDPVHVGHQNADSGGPCHAFQPLPEHPEVIADRFEERVQGDSLAGPARRHLPRQRLQVGGKRQARHLKEEHVHGVGRGLVNVLRGNQGVAVGNGGEPGEEVFDQQVPVPPEALQQLGPFRFHGPPGPEVAGSGRGGTGVAAVVCCHEPTLCKSINFGQKAALDVH